jgi:hypothetical protein
METTAGMEDGGGGATKLSGDPWRGELAVVLESVENKPTTEQWARVAELVPDAEWSGVIECARSCLPAPPIEDVLGAGTDLL